LPDSENQNFEDHLSECDPCVDTIRDLKVESDTLNDLTVDALQFHDRQSREGESESQVMQGIMQRMKALPGKPLVTSFDSASHTAQDRAAEVQRLIDPAIEPEDLGMIGDYRIISLLGAGSTGVVYRAIDRQLERVVALKVLRPSLGQAARSRFVAEARAAAALSHPNVVPIFQSGNHGDLAFMAMQWIPGQTLEQLLTERETLSVDEVKKLGTQIAGGLAAAHELGLIHRDIKPANIWIAEETGDATILDFGLVRINDENPQLTCTGMIAGTPCFMSPEQSRGQKLDGRSDLFSLGCLLYRSAVGNLPFESGNALATLQAIQRETPTPLREFDPGIPADFSDLVMVLLEKSPSRRPSSATDVMAAINSPRKDWPFRVPKPQLQTESTKSKPRFGWKTVAAAIAFFTLAALGIFFQPQITRIVTNQGEIVIECEVDDVQVEILQNGEHVRVIDLATEQAIDIKAGNYEIRPTGKDNRISIENGVLTLTRGEQEVVRITRDFEKELLSEQNLGSVAGTSEHSNPKEKYAPGRGVKTIRVDLDRNPEVKLKVGDVNRIVFDSDVVRIQFSNSQSIRVNTLTSKELMVTALKPGTTRCTIELDGEDDLGTFSVIVSEELYRLAAGDVLGMFVEGVLGEPGKSPPVNIPDAETGLPPSVGFPVPVRENGKISLPLIENLDVNGRTIEEVEEMVKSAFTEGEDPILKEGRIIVSLMQGRDYTPPTLARSALNLELRLKLYELQQEKAELRQRFAANHPKVVQLNQQIEFTKGMVAEGSIQAEQSAGGASLAENEEYQFRAVAGAVFRARAKADEHVKKGDLTKALMELENAKALINEITSDSGTATREGLMKVIVRDISALNDRLSNTDRAAGKDQIPPASPDSIERAVQPESSRQGDAIANRPLAVYDGRTYPEWLELVKYERDLTILNPAVKALAILASEDQKQEMIDAIMLVSRRKTNLMDAAEAVRFSEFLARFLRQLEPLELAQVVDKEFANGTATSKSLIIKNTPGIVRSLLEANKAEKVKGLEQILNSMIDNLDSQENTSAWQALTVLHEFRRSLSYPYVENEQLMAYVRELSTECLFETTLSRQSQLLFFEWTPDLEGLKELIVDGLIGFTKGNQNSWRNNYHYLAFSRLPENLRKEIVGQLVDKFAGLSDDQVAERFVGHLDLLSREHLKELQPYLEKLKEIAKEKGGNVDEDEDGVGAVDAGGSRMMGPYWPIGLLRRIQEIEEQNKTSETGGE
jgi:serine/threonine protein kinase/protein involved in polysaccharide export with SLBB domain